MEQMSTPRIVQRVIAAAMQATLPSSNAAHPLAFCCVPGPSVLAEWLDNPPMDDSRCDGRQNQRIECDPNRFVRRKSLQAKHEQTFHRKDHSTNAQQ
jgi:hypothetical protein